MVNLPYKTRKLFWVGDSQEQISSFPPDAKRQLGSLLRQVQNGITPEKATPLTEFGSGVFEIRADDNGNTYRTVYLIKLKKGIYVIDAFMKKSKKGKEIPQEIKERIRNRIKCAKDTDKG